MVHSLYEWSSPADVYMNPVEGTLDVALLDLSPDKAVSLNLASTLRQLHPGCLIIACSPVSLPDPELLLQALRAGVQEFLSTPLDPKALGDTLNRFLEERKMPVKDPSKKVLLVMGSKGGVGTSTVAVNLAVQLTEITEKRVGLLDFVSPLGSVALLLDLQPRYTVCDAVENVERMDDHFLGSLLTPHPSGLQVLAGTPAPDERLLSAGRALAKVVRVAQTALDYLVIDGGTYSSHWTRFAEPTPLILLIAEAREPSLWSLERQLSSLAAAGIRNGNVRVVINRWHRKFQETLQSAEKALEHPIFARLPNDYRKVSEATNLGTPLSKNPGDPLTVRFRELACQLAGVPDPARTKQGLCAQLSFLTKAAPSTQGISPLARSGADRLLPESAGR
ncbi:MAG TPA: P-loop NTPase [Candidatus Acidoferrales bacterium]|nr:P-loop NTPase [Candidatus Acidoferrales bacterium]